MNEKIDRRYNLLVAPDENNKNEKRDAGKTGMNAVLPETAVMVASDLRRAIKEGYGEGSLLLKKPIPDKDSGMKV